MVAYNASQHVRAFTRKAYGRTIGPGIRGRTQLKTRRRRGFFPKNAGLTVLPPLTMGNTGLRLVKVNNHSRANKRAKRLATMDIERNVKRNRRTKRRVKEWKAIVKQINVPEIRDNIGLYIDETGKLVSDEDQIIPEQYDLLVEELENRLDPDDDDYEQRVLHKAILFVKKAKAEHAHAGEMNNLERMMAAL
jgi:hypothetical protein